MAPRKTTPEAESASEDTKQAQSTKAATTKPKAKTTPAKAAPKKATPAKTPTGSNSSGIAADHLQSFFDRIERLEGEKKGIADDIKDVFAEAKGNGFDVPTMRAILKIKKQKPSEREEKESMLDLYMHALGMLEGDLDEAQQLGIDAASAGKAVTDNLYITEDPRFKKWEQGWQMQTAFLAAQDREGAV
ncbi:DUF2312 domain-containing protein [Pseudovibrio sp. WM33]|uniref:DUF2312 domain-containing protein n=1 Tax=Pseudovibrio sp. WM33 TaxID=1735585 RepID=UPI0007B3112F|nr:hypothetical protein PsWM33_04751 [Pseudovibrio sp. WM33]